MEIEEKSAGEKATKTQMKPNSRYQSGSIHLGNAEVPVGEATGTPV